jgi:hypothetical protein
VHKILGFIVIFLGICATSSGLGQFQQDYRADNPTVFWMYLNGAVFCTIIGLMEIAYRLFNKYSTAELKLDAGTESWSVERIRKEALDDKRHIVVLDNQVLDVDRYDGAHPGGKFVFTKNYGRDISKFFYGGYKLVQLPHEENFTHSGGATILADGMVVGHIEGQQNCKPVAMKLEGWTAINSNTSTFKLTCMEAKTGTNFRQWYSDLAMIGRHFLVYSKATPQVKRQYTICNSIVPNTYNALITLADISLSGSQVGIANELFSSNDGDTIFLTCKDYKTITGVASQLHLCGPGEAIRNHWFVKGPMGMGLSIDRDGHNIAFCGGTGMLVFLDLVAQICLHICGKTSDVFGPNFKFSLYYATQSDEQAIGLELCQRVSDLSHKLGIPIFKF